MKISNILLSGEGGQGIQTIAGILTECFNRAGKIVSYIPIFGVEQRGTPSTSLIRLSDTAISYPRFDHADYAIILQKRSLNQVASYLVPSTRIIFDSSTVSSSLLKKFGSELFGIPATKIATEQFVPKSFNMIVLGKLGRVLAIDKNILIEVMKEKLGKKFKSLEIEKQNIAALEFGYNFVFEVKSFTKATFFPDSELIVEKSHGRTAIIAPSRCKSCGICVKKCPVRAITFGDNLGVFSTPVPQIDLEKCIVCGNCYRFCPDGAIRVSKN